VLTQKEHFYRFSYRSSTLVIAVPNNNALLQKIFLPITTLPVGDHAKVAEKQAWLILTTAY
jgi:hypothetical protein